MYVRSKGFGFSEKSVLFTERLDVKLTEYFGECESESEMMGAFGRVARLILTS